MYYVVGEERFAFQKYVLFGLVATGRFFHMERYEHTEYVCGIMRPGPINLARLPGVYWGPNLPLGDSDILG